jgi:hypothetical protein
MKKYFSVETKCGHVGKLNCVWIKFAISAESAKEAAAKARQIARVKHHHKNTIKEVIEITVDEFLKLKAINDVDPYLHAKNHREQLQIEGFEERIELDEYNIARKHQKSSKKESLEFRVKRANAKEKSHKRALKEYFYEEAMAW